MPTRKEIVVIAVGGALSLALTQGSAAGGPPTQGAGAARPLRLSLVPPPATGSLAGLKAFQLSLHGGRIVTLETGGGPRSWVLPTACRQLGTYQLSSRSLVSLPFVVTPTECRRGEIRVPLFLRADIRLRAKAPAGARLPKEAIIELSPCPKGLLPKAAPRGARLPLALPDSGEIRVPAPAGCLDVTLVTKTFAPVSWWGVGVAAGKTTDLGVASLKKGASLLVRTIDADDGWPLPGARVVVVDAGHVRAATRAALNGHFPGGLASGVSGTRGWLRLSGLPDGSYTLLATAQKHAVACRNVALKSGEETVVDDLEIGHPGSLDISVGLDPSKIPDGYHLTLALVPSVCCRQIQEAARTVKVPDAGFLHLTGLNPGSWELEAMLMTDSGLAYDVATARASVPSGAGANVELDVKGALYHGSVTRDDEPLAADLRFSREHAEATDNAVHASASSDGRFTVFLPGVGVYRVSVRLPGSASVIPVDGVTVEDPETPITVKVPSGRIRGTVLDERGDAVSGAAVAAWRREAGPGSSPLFARAKSNTDGTFTLEGIAAGRWSLSAHRGDLASAPVTVTVAKDRRPAWVKLVLRKTITQKGRAVFVDGSPASGVSIGAWNVSIAGRGRAPRLVDTTTRADGSFELHITGKQGDVVNVFLAGPGIAADAALLRLSRNPWTLRVSRSGGRLGIVLPKRQGVGAIGSLVLLR